MVYCKLAASWLDRTTQSTMIKYLRSISKQLAPMPAEENHPRNGSMEEEEGKTLNNEDGRHRPLDEWRHE